MNVLYIPFIYIYVYIYTPLDLNWLLGLVSRFFEYIITCFNPPIDIAKWKARNICCCRMRNQENDTGVDPRQEFGNKKEKHRGNL